MHINPQKRQIRKLLQRLFTKYCREDVTSISALEIAVCLECPEDVAENVLVTLWEKGVVEPGYKIYCGFCDSVMAYYAAPRDFTGFVECPYCYSQPEGASKKDLVLAYGAPYERDIDK
jgi:hypothetical protein